MITHAPTQEELDAAPLFELAESILKRLTPEKYAKNKSVYDALNARLSLAIVAYNYRQPTNG